MPSLPVSPHKQDLIIDISPTLLIQRINIGAETLPLRGAFLARRISGVGAVDQSKVYGGL